MPRDYKRVLEERAARASENGADGRDADADEATAAPAPEADANGQATTAGPVAVGATADA
jgi:hypothetical protein